MARYYLDDQVFDSHSDYVKAVREKEKQLRAKKTKEIEAEYQKQVEALKSANKNEQLKAQEIIASKANTAPIQEKLNTDNNPTQGGLKGQISQKIETKKAEIEDTTTYKQGKTIKEWNNGRKDLNRRRDAINNTDVLNDAEKKEQLKKIREAKKTLTKQKAKEGLNNMKIVQRIQSRVKAIKEKIKALLPILKWVLLIVAVVTFLWNAFLFFKGVFSIVGQTPHYYCELEATRGMKNSPLYKQYCQTGGLNLEELNGHYIIQDGSGPCTSCATLNLYMRYFTANGVNFFDYLWDDNGELASGSFPENSQSAQDWYHYISCVTTSYYDTGDNTSGGSTGNRRHMSETGSWYQFATSHYSRTKMTSTWGNIPNWGYYYSEDVYDMGTSGYGASRFFNTEWVYDVFGYGCLGPGKWARWYVNCGSYTRSITIDGVTATLVVKSGAPSSQQELISLLQTHPSGVGFVLSNGDMAHGMLWTKYEDGTFYIVDSGLGRWGGFEGPADNSSFCIASQYYQSMINMQDWNGYWYIEEDVNTPTS